MKDSLYFPNIFQMVGQGNTSDAEFMVNTSLYIPPHGAAADEYDDRALPSLPKLFEQKGYQTATFHTNAVEFWNRKELYKALGFAHYYDKSFFGDADPVQIISLSSHHPFDIPESKYHITLPARYENTFVGDYIRAENYTDYALGLFIAELKESHVWENSLFVIYGDHMGLPIYSLSDKDKALLFEIYGKDYGYSQMMNIPLLIFAPGTTPPEVLNQVGGQVDFMPTIANLSGLSLRNLPHFGQDLINNEHNLLPEHYYLPTGSFINDNSVFVPGNGFEDGQQFNLNGKETDNPIKATEDEYNRALRLFQMSDTYVNQLPLHD
jgi:lipoteichoic acid synthase